MTGAKCQLDNDFIVNGSCRIKAVRGGFGVFEQHGIYVKYMYDFSVHVQLYYKYRTVYRTYLFDNTFKPCEIVEPGIKTKAKFEQLIFFIFKSFGANSLTPCPVAPYVIDFKYVLDEAFEGVFKQFKLMLPAGDYKLLVTHFNEKNNHTYMTVELKFNIKATSGMDFNKFLMG